MPFSNSAKNMMLNALAGTAPGTPITHASLHDDDPGSGGANELAGGSPAYARRPIAFDPASGGAMSQDGASLVFDVPAGSTVKFAGFWSAASAGTFLGAAALVHETYAGQGTYTLVDSDLDLNG